MERDLTLEDLEQRHPEAAQDVRKVHFDTDLNSKNDPPKGSSNDWSGFGQNLLVGLIFFVASIWWTYEPEEQSAQPTQDDLNIAERHEVNFGADPNPDTFEVLIGP